MVAVMGSWTLASSMQVSPSYSLLRLLVCLPYFCVHLTGQSSFFLFLLLTWLAPAQPFPLEPPITRVSIIKNSTIRTRTEIWGRSQSIWRFSYFQNKLDKHFQYSISNNYLHGSRGLDPNKKLNRKIMLCLFLSFLIGWKIWAANQNA